MSSKITTLYDAIVTRMATVFPNHFRLPVAYAIEANPEGMIAQGYAIQMGNGSNLKLSASCQMDIERAVTIALTREFKALELDVTYKASAEKSLLEDQYLLIKDFETSTALNDPSVGIFDFVSDSGIQAVFTGKSNFLKIDSVFRLRYFESL